MFSSVTPQLILLSRLDPLIFDKVVPFVLSSSSQLGQDLLPLIFGCLSKPNNYFVEVGAADGINNSNTFLLESVLQWSGLLVEPARSNQEKIKRNRNVPLECKAASCADDQSLDFIEYSMSDCKNDSPENQYASQFSGFATTLKSTYTKGYDASRYQVQTTRLSSSLISRNAPTSVDFLSIDTEGSELDVLSGIDFSVHSFRVITIEHNFNRKKRSIIRDRLLSFGYINVFPSISRWDDWFVHGSYISEALNTDLS